MSFIFAIAAESKTDIFLLKLNAPSVLSISRYLSNVFDAWFDEFKISSFASFDGMKGLGRWPSILSQVANSRKSIASRFWIALK